MKTLRLLAAALTLFVGAASAAPITGSFSGSLVQNGLERGYTATYTYDDAISATTTFASSTFSSMYRGALSDMVLTFDNGDFVRATGDIRVDNTYAPTARKTLSLYGDVLSSSSSMSTLDRLSVQFAIPDVTFSWDDLNALLNGDARLKLESGDVLSPTVPTNTTGTSIPVVSTFSSGVNYVVQFGMIVAVQPTITMTQAPQLTTIAPAVPEPSMLILMLAGLLAMAFKTRRMSSLHR